MSQALCVVGCVPVYWVLYLDSFDGEFKKNTPCDHTFTIPG